MACRAISGSRWPSSRCSRWHGGGRILNLLPVPGLDGYGVIEPWLSYNVRRQVEPLAPFGLLIVFACLLWIPAVNGVFFDAIDAILRGLGISELDTYCGFELYRFWQTDQLCSVSP